MNYPVLDLNFQNRVKSKFLEYFTEEELNQMVWGGGGLEHSVYHTFAWRLLLIKNVTDNPGNPHNFPGNTPDLIQYYRPYKNVVLQRILPILAWALDDICPQYGSQSSTGHSQIAVRLTSRDPVRVWVAVGPYKATLNEAVNRLYNTLQFTEFYMQTPEQKGIGSCVDSDLGLTLSSLRLRLDSLESTVGGRDIALTARAPPARNSAFRMVRRRQAGDFRGSGTDHLLPQYAESIKGDRVKLFEYMMVHALPTGMLENRLDTGIRRVSFLKIWKGLCRMGTAGRLWVTKSILSYDIAEQKLDSAYLEYKNKNRAEAEKEMCLMLRSFLVSIVIYEVCGHNLNVVKAALTVPRSSTNDSPMIASSYSGEGSMSTDMMILFNKCLRYATETDAVLKHRHLLDFARHFQYVMLIQEGTSMDAWAAGVLHGSH